MLIALFVYLLTAVIMAGIGISQLRSEKPVGFYSGEKPPAESELTDVQAWNVRHGAMWLVYSAIIIASYGIGAIIPKGLWRLLPMLGGPIVPIIIMVLYHKKLIKKYRK